MKAYLFTSLVFAGLWSNFAHAEVMIGSALTNTTNDCIVESSATEQAPIDFYSAQCKSFGDYVLKITGSDLRYGPALWFHGQQIDLARPMSFYDLADENIEWIYSREFDAEGSGTITWKGLVYTLSTASEDGQSDVKQTYAVRLDGEKTCPLGIAANSDEAKKLILDPASACQ